MNTVSERWLIKRINLRLAKEDEPQQLHKSRPGKQTIELGSYYVTNSSNMVTAHHIEDLSEWDKA